MRIFSDFNEIKSAVGTEIGVSDWVKVTQERINQFAEATCDEQWIHVDQERAAREMPGGKATLLETAPGISIGEVLAVTEAELAVPDTVPAMQI